ncbi:hypothetical protein D3C72_1560970 [compost metagenome]
MKSSGLCSTSQGSASAGLVLLERMSEMLSTPPATMAGAPSTMMRPAANAIACRPEAQKRLTTVPPTLMGRPARTAAWRPMLRPVVPSG